MCVTTGNGYSSTVGCWWFPPPSFLTEVATEGGPGFQLGHSPNKQYAHMQIYKYIRRKREYSGVGVVCYIYMGPLYIPPIPLMGEMSEAECMSDGMVKEFTPI